MSTRISELVGGVFFMGLSLLFWWQTVGQSDEGVEAALNPIWYPRVLLVLMGITSALLIFRSIKGGSGEEVPLPNFRQTLIVLTVLIVFFYGFVEVGFLFASIVFIPLFNGILGYRRWGITTAVSLILTSIVWYLFAEVFVVRPPGIGIDELLQIMGGQ